jgi:hypothetical protein
MKRAGSVCVCLGKEYEGTVMGLALARKVVEKCEAKLASSPRPGKCVPGNVKAFSPKSERTVQYGRSHSTRPLR